ncbi:MAG TPA: hypothetical protein VLA82_08170 [Actinomycetota bacterium]|nr:hypothetical protein [Actinomycetota bacterium]
MNGRLEGKVALILIADRLRVHDGHIVESASVTDTVASEAFMDHGAVPGSDG